VHVWANPSAAMNSSTILIKKFCVYILSAYFCELASSSSCSAFVFPNFFDMKNSAKIFKKIREKKISNFTLEKENFPKFSQFSF